MNLLPKLLLVLVFVFSVHHVFSQTPAGSIKGVVKDSLKNEFISGVSVRIAGTDKSTVSNSAGEFSFTELGDGEYKLSFNASGFREFDKMVTISNGQQVDLGNINMEVQVKFTGAGIRITVKQTTVAAGIKEVKEAEVVSNVETAESFKNTQASDAAKVAARIPGVTLMENRFIMLRGLSQRYNSVQINNINAPSTETDRRAFSFDLVPSSMLDKIAIYKSPSSDLAGDFAGGVIKLQTKNEIEKDFFSVNLGLGYRVNTTFLGHENNSVGSTTDLLGFDNGNRALPGSFPSSLSGFNSTQSVQYGKTLRNNFSSGNFTTPLDFGFGFGFGKNIKVKKNMKLFTVNNFSYATNYQFASMHRYRYQNDQTEYVRQMFNYNDDNFAVESKFSILSNWIFKPNKKATFSFKNIFNQIGENETTIRTGVNLTERPTDEFKNYSYHYTSRSIYFGQFEGSHKLKRKGDKFIYTLGYSNIGRNEPDYRRFRTYRTLNSDGPYTLIDPPSASLFDAARFYSKLKEHTVAANINYEKHFTNQLDSNKDMIFRAGAYGESKNRDFNARWISYSYNGNPMNKNEFLMQPVNEIFSGDNINTAGGFKPLEGTNPSDHYSASNKLLSGYINASIPFNKFNINLGVRAEFFQQILKSATQNGPVNVNLDTVNILPSINAAYYLNKKNLLRLAYGKTVNRPEFRELAPFVYYDFMYDVNIVGNPNLKPATIDNLDLRFENYPSKNETISFGVFYKRFLNPIENYVQPIGLSQQFYLKNAKSATNMGAELEARKSFEESSQNHFIKKLSVVLNASYIVSKVDLGKDSTLSQARTRPLQGQSPYIVNMTIQYKNDSGLTVNVAYNIFGKRIVYVGNNIFPTVYEMPRHSIDLTITKEINKKFSLKFGVSDVLNYKNQLWQDTNNDGVINYKKDRTDHQLLQYRRGQMISLGITYKVN
jgi:TonB-dependent receptor